MTKRNLSLATLSKFRVGYDDGSNKFSMFSNRITFPVTDFESGRVCEFQARATLPDQHPKYIHGKFALIGGKMRSLYGLYENLENAVRTDAVVLVEGPVDVLTLYQFGIPAVCVFGTVFSDFQAMVLSQVASNWIDWSDGDKAGNKFGAKVKDRATKYGCNVYKVQNKQSKDPNDTLAEFGYTGIMKAIDGVELV
jgi:DNA primase